MAGFPLLDRLDKADQLHLLGSAYFRVPEPEDSLLRSLIVVDASNDCPLGIDVACMGWREEGEHPYLLLSGRRYKARFVGHHGGREIEESAFVTLVLGQVGQRFQPGDRSLILVLVLDRHETLLHLIDQTAASHDALSLRLSAADPLCRTLVWTP